MFSLQAPPFLRDNLLFKDDLSRKKLRQQPVLQENTETLFSKQLIALLRDSAPTNKLHATALHREHFNSFSYHFADFNHTAASILVSTNWFDDSCAWLLFLFLFYL